MARKKSVDFRNGFDFWGYYSGVVGDARQNGENGSGRCPLHDDSSSSFSFNITNGLWICFAACGKGDITSFHAKLKGVPRDEAEDELEVLAGLRKIVPDEEIATAHQALMSAPTALERLLTTRGITEETAKEYRLGYADGRWWIPVMERGIAYNVRKHDATGSSAAKCIHWDVGTGDNRLFPYSRLKGDGPIYLMGGELKAILANQLGLRSVSCTGGEGAWRPRFNEHFKGQDVVICYDIDEKGRKGAIQVAAQLAPIAQSVKVVELPITEPANGDFADYILRHGHTANDFLALVEGTPKWTVPVVGAAAIAESMPEETTLSGASDKNMYFKKVTFEATVSGKDLSPFYAPKKVALSCNRDQGEKCQNCGMFYARGPMAVDFSPFSQDILNLIRVTDKQQKGLIRARAGIPQSCGAWDMEMKEVYNVEELRVIPAVDLSKEGNEYVTRLVYSVSDGSVAANKTYKMTGISIPDPSSQYVTQILSEVDPVATSLDRFQMSDEIAALLRVFRPGPGQSVREKIAALCEDISYNVARIYHREDIIQAMLMVYCSVLSFRFNGDLVRKGWMEVLVMGDTRTGKSEIIYALSRFIGAGEVVTAENSSYAGLVGGMSQEQKRWHITWGKIPLNNRGLLFIEETSGLSEESIGAMSGLRSSGIAEITKIQTERTESRTRLIWVSNPRHKKKMDDFSYGVVAIKELIGNPEDVARFDMAVTSASAEVDLQEINAKHHKIVPHDHTAEAMAKLVLWAWSRKEDQVEFEDDAVDAVLSAAMDMGQRYSASIPLVEPAEQRIKLARMSVAIAALTFSTDRSNQKVVVKKDHVKEAADFLDRAYKKPSMGYDMFSSSVVRATRMDDPKADRIKGQFVGFDNWKVIKQALLASHRFHNKDLQAHIGYDNDEARQLFRWLGVNGLVQTTTGGFVKQPAFTRLLKEIDDEKPPKVIALDKKEGDIS